MPTVPTTPSATPPAPSKRPSLKSRLRKALFGSATAALRVDPTGATETAAQKMLVSRLADQPARLQSLAWQAEAQGDFTLALRAWLAIAAGPAPQKGSGLTMGKVYGKLAVLETRLRRTVALYDPGALPDLGTMPEVALDPEKFVGHSKPGARSLQRQAGLLADYWDAARKMTAARRARLCKAYAALAAKRNKAQRQHIARAALQPVLAAWPDYQTAYPLFYKATLQELVQDRESGVDTAVAEAQLEAWWRFFATVRDRLTASTLGQIWSLTLRFAQRLQDGGGLELSDRVIAAAFDVPDDNTAALPLMARACELRGDVESAARHWQLYAAIMNPVSTKSGTIVAKNAKDRARRANYGRSQLREMRARLALEHHDAGRIRAFRELAVRVVESLPDQRQLKYSPLFLDVARRYVQEALREDGAFQTPVPRAPGQVRRVVLALDILKVSEVHTHSRVVFTMCRNLLLHDPDLEIDVVVTNERFAVTTPVVSPSFGPGRETALETRARAALGDLYDSRFRLHVHQGSGLEGVVRSTRAILDLGPDLVLYGGGHRGLFSNESRLVRHALYDLVPAVFFYIQANNQVDPKFDMIIARGPHAIEGEPGETCVRVQPYPTIVDLALAEAQSEIDPRKARAKTIVSAITGVRMDVRLSEMTKAEMADFFSILDRVEGSVWHFIGCQDIAAVRAANPEIAKRMDAGRIRLHTVMPFEAFTDLVGNASLFLHLPGFTGGSGGAAVARRGAIPILTFNHSDVSGRQPPDTVFEEDARADFADRAVKLLTDEADWRATAQAQIDHTAWIRETSVQGFHDCLSEAARLGRARLTAGGAVSADG
ncbi:hypothetical protein [Jannaschia marina]|uniref:hypothetical protein n=1 Tax=Jannaschia marina TaxID=2741674 RepID=UPI0015C7B9D2|nr:hypothetical protein [Jannaschia marina]